LTRTCFFNNANISFSSFNEALAFQQLKHNLRNALQVNPYSQNN
jgi:hypothetical protein